MARSSSTLMIAAPSSGSGKTLITLALLRALKNRDVDVRAAKAGPDYIDPTFHSAASGASSINLDPWAMSKVRVNQLAKSQGGDLLLVEAMMGLFDGAADGSGSAADLAGMIDAPIILAVDAAKQSHSIAALVQGFASHRDGIKIAGVVLNKVGSARHEAILRDALEKIGMPVMGAVYRDDRLVLPERHLGLVQAGEHGELESFIATAANIIEKSCDLGEIVNAASVSASQASAKRLPPLGQHIAVAKDATFSFIYPHLLADWRAQGAELSFFSPLLDEAPNADADAIYLPGGYPELNADQLSAAANFKNALHEAARSDRLIYGECGGYMVLGEGIEDKAGKRHEMLGLLKLVTSFAKRKLHLGYRRITALSDFKLGQKFNAHEFHYTSAMKEEGNPLFEAQDALGASHGQVGLRDGRVMGSYMHIVDGVGQ